MANCDGTLCLATYNIWNSDEGMPYRVECILRELQKVRAEIICLLNRMLRWHIYLKYREPVDMGILDSNMEKLLEVELFLLYKKTYPTADYNEIWKAYDAVVELWHKASCLVAEDCGYSYPEETERNMLNLIANLVNT